MGGCGRLVWCPVLGPSPRVSGPFASPRSPRWALVVVGDLVEGVYRIDHWEPTPTGPATGVGRSSFVGTADPELAARYVGRNVGPYLGPGTPSAVTYVWCGPHWVDPAI